MSAFVHIGYNNEISLTLGENIGFYKIQSS